MKKFFSKIWAAIKAPACYLAVFIIGCLFIYGLIDGFIRCCNGSVFNGLVQVILICAGLPLGAITIQALRKEAKSIRQTKN